MSAVVNAQSMVIDAEQQPGDLVFSPSGSDLTLAIDKNSSSSILDRLGDGELVAYLDTCM